MLVNIFIVFVVIATAVDVLDVVVFILVGILVEFSLI